MPTRYWLVSPAVNAAVGRLEAAGSDGVRRAAAKVPADALPTCTSATRWSATPVSPPGHAGPAPSGGVGGTRQGVKCLHAHYAWHLAGGDDPVGRWVAAQLQRPSERS